MATTRTASPPPLIRIDSRPPLYGTTDDEVNQLDQLFQSTARYIFTSDCTARWRIPPRAIFFHVAVRVFSSAGHVLFKPKPTRIGEDSVLEKNDYLAGHFHAALDWMSGQRAQLLQTRMERARRNEEAARAAEAAALGLDEMDSLS